MINDNEEIEEDTQREKYLTFLLDNESYGIGINKVSNKYISGIGKMGNQVKLILDCDKLINYDYIDNLNIIEQ